MRRLAARRQQIARSTPLRRGSIVFVMTMFFAVLTASAAEAGSLGPTSQFVPIPSGVLVATATVIGGSGGSSPVASGGAGCEIVVTTNVPANATWLGQPGTNATGWQGGTQPGGFGFSPGAQGGYSGGGDGGGGGAYSEGVILGQASILQAYAAGGGGAGTFVEQGYPIPSGGSGCGGAQTDASGEIIIDGLSGAGYATGGGATYAANANLCSPGDGSAGNLWYGLSPGMPGSSPPNPGDGGDGAGVGGPNTFPGGGGGASSSCAGAGGSNAGSGGGAGVSTVINPGAPANGELVTIPAPNGTQPTAQLDYISIAIPPMNPATVGQAFSTQIVGTYGASTTVSGAQASWSISPALPPGLKFDPESGAITGTPTTPQAATSYTVTAQWYTTSSQTTILAESTGTFTVAVLPSTMPGSTDADSNHSLPTSKLASLTEPATLAQTGWPLAMAIVLGFGMVTLGLVGSRVVRRQLNR